MPRNRSGFWSEAVFSQMGSTIPSRVRRGNERVKWSIDAILAELLRLDGHCGHVEKPMPPTHIWGLPPDRLRDRVEHVYANSELIKETYTRRGKEHRRRQKKSTPTVLMAVASWPEPNINATEMRARWERRVIRAARSRWGPCVIGVYAHTDEARYHLHVWVDNDGHPVKQMHAGFGDVIRLLEDKPYVSRQEQAAAYKIGVAHALDWYHDRVGRHFGMRRKGLTPRPRMSRAGALRDRQEKIEAAEELAMSEWRRIAIAKTEVLEHTAALQKALARLRAREEALEHKSDAVAHLRDAVEDQLRLEDRLKRDRYEGPSVF